MAKVAPGEVYYTEELREVSEYVIKDMWRMLTYDIRRELLNVQIRAFQDSFH